MSTNINLKNSTDTTFSITHSDGANTKVLDSKDIAVAIDTVADFPANPNNGDVVIVRDLNRGGTFIYDSSEVAGSNDGTNFDGWIRQYSGAVNVKWFGAVGDGIVDDTVAIQASLSYLVNGGDLYIQSGTYSITSHITVPAYVKIIGTGKRKSVLKRNATIDLITLGSYSGLIDIGIDGNTAVYGAGKGCLIIGSTFNQYILNSEIKNFSNPCLEFAANGGSEFKSSNSDFYTTGTQGVVGAVTVNGIDSAAVPRHFISTGSGGCTLFNFGGCNDFFASGFYSNGLIFSFLQVSRNTEKYFLKFSPLLLDVPISVTFIFGAIKHFNTKNNIVILSS